MRRLNVDRMRRYVARTTPSHFVITEWDLLTQTSAELREHCDTWTRRMAVKYKDSRVSIHMVKDSADGSTRAFVKRP